MKLDSIVYDYNSLQTAIANQLNSESSTFQAIYPSDTATSLVNVLASYGSMLQYQLVSAMANMYTDSAYSEAGIQQLAETLGNRLHGNISSQIYCNITRTNLEGRVITIPAGSKFTVENLNFFNPETVVFPSGTNTIPNVKLIQGVKLVSEQVASGISGERLYFCDDFRCNTDMVRVYVDDVEWDITDSFLPYVVTDESIAAKSQAVILKTDPDGRTYIKFGNNSNGRIPEKGKVIRIEYIANEGADGNLNNTNLEIKLSSPIYYTVSPGIRKQLEVDITAISTASGGFNTQSIDILKQSSPYVFASGQRAVRRNDYKAMLLNKCGYLTCNVWGEYEEAAIQGGYDKIMMNMVYYTGIKSMQKYDLQPITQLNLDTAEISQLVDDTYNVSGNIAGARGFAGSYILDVASYTSEDTAISVKYCDKQGTGILTCDPSVNNTLSDFETNIFPIDDFLTDKVGYTYNFGFSVNQKLSQEQTSATLTRQLVEGTVWDPTEAKYVEGDWTSSGKNLYNEDALITFDTPFQFRLDFASRTTLCALAFKTPEKSLYGNFIHKFAIYGTNIDIPDDGPEPYYLNVKNNNNWKKLTGIQTIDAELDERSFSDWTTLKVYDPNTSTEEYEDLTSDTAKTEFILSHDHSGTEDFSYIVKVAGEIKSSNEYSLTDFIGADGLRTKITFLEEIPANTPVVVTCILYDWSKYKHYVIEVYEIHDANNKSPTKVSISKIKAIYKKSASTLNYTANNTVDLKIPLRDNDGTKVICLPDKMQYYKYKVSINNVDDEHHYNTNERLTWTNTINDTTYTFTVTVLNLAAQQFKITIDTDGMSLSEVLRGKDKITVSNADLTGTPGSGGTISITSESSVNLYGSYTGNFYSNRDIQATDLPTINKYNHFTTYLEFRQPLIKNVTIAVNVEYENITNYQTVHNEVSKAINALFDLHAFSIGSTLNVSDIWKAVNSVEGVKRFNVLTPLDNIDCLPYELLVLPAENLIINDIINNEYK